MGAISFIIENILTQAPITIVLIAMLGLLLQKKSAGQAISDTLKTLLGFQVLSAGSSIIVGSLTYFGRIFTEGFHMQEIISSIESINGQAVNDLGLGRGIAPTFLATLVFNILSTWSTEWKYISPTGQAILWMVTMTTVFGYFAGLRGIVLILVGDSIGTCFAIAMPAVAQPIVRKITGLNDIALGHFCMIGYLFEADVAKLFGERGENKKSIEDIKLPTHLEFLQDTYLSVMVVMVLLYIITILFAGEPFASKLSGDQNYIMFAFLQAIQFVVDVYVSLAGVRPLLGEIVLAFRRIAMESIPDAIPVLDCPVFFPYSPDAVILGFVTTMIGTTIAMFTLSMFGLAMILPGMLTNFFVGGTAGISGNAAGGHRGAIIGGIARGPSTTLLPALSVTIFNSMGFINATATDVDTIAAALLYAWILNPILKAFQLKVGKMMFGFFKKKENGTKKRLTRGEKILLPEAIERIQSEITQLNRETPMIQEKHELVEPYEQIGLKSSESYENDQAIQHLEKGLENEWTIGDGYKKLMSLYNQKHADVTHAGDDQGIDYYMGKMDGM